jgi:hypothetical protein
MEEIAISKFKATCLAVLENVRKTGKAIVVTRFGEPMAEVLRMRPGRRRIGWVRWRERVKESAERVVAFAHLLVGGPDPLPENSLTLHPNPQSRIANAMDLVPMREAPITYQVGHETARVQFPRSHPADRFLVAAARVFGPTLVTADEQLLQARRSSVASLGKPLKAGEFSLDRRPWPKTTTLVEPGHRSAGSRGLSSPLPPQHLADNKAVV